MLLACGILRGAVQPQDPGSLPQALRGERDVTHETERGLTGVTLTPCNLTQRYVLKLVLYSIVYSCSRPSYRRTTELQWRTWIMVTALRQHPTRTIGSVVA